MEHNDHRTRVGAERRHRMRLRLVESALRVFAEKGLDTAMIDDVIAAAGVSRGTFYNYFRTEAELVAAVSGELTNETVECIESAVVHLPNPAERVARGLRLYLGAAARFPLFARFTSQAGFAVTSPNHRLLEYLPRHITEGVKLGRMDVPDVSLAVDLIVGATLSAVHALCTRTVPRHYVEHMVTQILIGLGVPRASARKLAEAPIDDIELPDDSLLARTQSTRSTGARRASVA